jgi:predicted amidohydrolase
VSGASRGRAVIAGFYQFAPARGRPEANRKRLEEALRSTRLDLLVCPELATTGYLYFDRAELLPLAEAVPGGPTCAVLTDACRETGRAIVLGLAERDGDRLYNSAVLLTPDGGAVCYRKAHLFDTETLVFDRSGVTPRHGRVAGARVGLLVCFDWRFPEMARTLALEGADLIAHPANLVHPYCQDAMITRSLENRVFTITASRTGEEALGATTLRFTGRSQIVSPRGERLAQADAAEECVRTAEIDVMLARDKRVTERNDLFGDRRPDVYGATLPEPGEPPAGGAR